MNPATRLHAVHLTTSRTAGLRASPRISLLTTRLPDLQSNGDTASVPLALNIPLPSRQRAVDLSVGVSALTGLVEVKDGGAGEGDARSARAKSTAAVINEKGRLPEEIGALLAVVGNLSRVPALVAGEMRLALIDIATCRECRDADEAAWLVAYPQTTTAATRCVWYSRPACRPNRPCARA